MLVYNCTILLTSVHYNTCTPVAPSDSAPSCVWRAEGARGNAPEECKKRLPLCGWDPAQVNVQTGTRAGVCTPVPGLGLRLWEGSVHPVWQFRAPPPPPPSPALGPHAPHFRPRGPYPLLLLPLGGLHSSENLDRLLHHHQQKLRTDS